MHHSPHSALQPVPSRSVTLASGFWAPHMRRSREVGIPGLFALLESHGVVDNFRRLRGAATARRGPLFTDSDLFKWMEAAGHSLTTVPAPDLRQVLDGVIDVVVGAQGSDGYLNTWFQGERAGQRFTRLATDHELYCAGHLIEAALACEAGTGDCRLLDAAARYADLLCARFGPGRIEESDGHPEVELALIALYRRTGARRYLDLAEFLLRRVDFAGQDEIAGHAVRALYFLCGLADLCAETGDSAARRAAERQWRSMVRQKMYVTGALGGRHVGESVGLPYELPNERAYAETCSSVACFLWNWRMLQLTGEARCADVMERALYNGVLGGVSLDGDAYFYVNPLAADGRGEIDPWYPWARRGPHRRSAWHDCTCCPPNVLRLMAALPGRMCSMSDDALWIHLYDQASVQVRLPSGADVDLRMQTDYPWDGDVEVTVGGDGPCPFTLALRVPDWAESATASGPDGEVPAVPGEYVRLRRVWRPGERVVLRLPMPARAVCCNPRVSENRGAVALARGPVVYCLEGVDNPALPVRDVRAVLDATGRPRRATWTHRPDLLQGVTLIEADGVASADAETWGALYRDAGTASGEPAAAAGDRSVGCGVRYTAVPYFAWANREPSAMTVWMPVAADAAQG